MTEERQQREQGRGGQIPAPLRERDQWIVMADKRPEFPPEGWQKGKNQFPYEEAVHLATRHQMEITYVLNSDDPYVVFDLDGVISDGELSADAIDIVSTLSSYTEVSRSGTGLHIFVRGERLPNHTYQEALPNGGQIEVYDADQCIVTTGDILYDHTEITSGGAAAVQEEYLTDWSESGAESDESLPEVQLTPSDERPESTEDLTPEDIRRTLEEYATAGYDAAQRALDYWETSDRAPNGEGIRIKADMTFVSDLAFWTREDPQLMDACFRASERMVGQWDQPIYRSSTVSRDSVTYGEDSISKAIQTNFSTFSGNYVTDR